MTPPQKTCFWALLSTSNLAFTYLSSSLRTNLPGDHAVLGTCFYDYLHPNEYVPAKRDISKSIEQRDLLGSVTRCRFRNIFPSHPSSRSRRKASVATFTQVEQLNYQGTQTSLPPIPTPPTQPRSPRSYFGSVASNSCYDRSNPQVIKNLEYDEGEYLVMDIALNVLCDGIVLGIFHPIDDEQYHHICGQQSYDSQDIEHWNQCVRYLSEQNRQQGSAGSVSGVPLTPNTPQSPSSKISSLNTFGTSLTTSGTYGNHSRVFFILDSDTLSPLLCWPEETFCKLTGAQQAPPPGSRGVLEHHLKPEDLRKIKEHLEKPPPTDGRLCIQRYTAKHSLTQRTGSIQYVQCIVIPYGSITFACFQSVAPLLSNFAAQQPLQLSLPPGKRHYSSLNEKVLDNKPVTSFTPPTGTSRVSHLLNPTYGTASGIPLSSGCPVAQSSSQSAECSISEQTSNIYSKGGYSYYPRNSRNRASLPVLPTLSNKESDPNFNANRRASEPHTNIERPRDKMNLMMSSSSLSRIPENQVPIPSPLSPNKRAFNEVSTPLSQIPGKKFRSEQEDLRVRVLGRNHSEGDIFRPMGHPGSHRRHSSPVAHREQPPPKGSLPPISQLVDSQSHHSPNELTYTQSSHPHVMSTPVGIQPQSTNPYRSPNSGLHAPSTQNYGVTRGGVPISFLHNSAAAQKRCESCNTSQSPEWRRGPTGHKTLCNACGLRYSRSIARAGKQQQKSTTVNVTPTSGSNAIRSIPNFIGTSSSSHSRQSSTKSDAFLERSSTHHYPVGHLSYPRPTHNPSSLPSSSGNVRGNR